MLKLKRKVHYLLPLRDTVIFPKATNAVLIGREKTIKAIEKAYESSSKIFVVSQKAFNVEKIKRKDLYDVGVLCNIVQKVQLPDGNIKILVEGVSKARLVKFFQDDGCYSAEVKAIRESRLKRDDEKVAELRKIVLNKFNTYIGRDTRIPQTIISSLKLVKSVDEFLFYIVTILPISTENKQKVLECRSDEEKLRKAFELVELELEILNTEKKISKNIDQKFLERRRKVYLNERLKYIKKELGKDAAEENSEVAELKEKIKKIKLPKEVREKCEKELKRMENMFSRSPEYAVLQNYLDWIISLPWGTKSKSKNDLKKAEKILERDHHGLEEVKKRILEFLAVYKRTGSLKGSIICLFGPPGVGKTSLARSIAEALNRKYVKVSLGGIRDEAEIRGHRRTYVGSMPGRIIQCLKKAKTSNPLVLLDEIDKISSDFRGNPSSALLEVLDPEQNKHFSDHYLEVDYDLSDVMFIATGNNLSNIPTPLRDRMEVIRISGYTENEKLEITKKYLIPKQLKIHGLTKKEFSITDKEILKIIRLYTFEAGVRNLEREIAKIIRKSVKKIVTDNKVKKVDVNGKNIKKYLGVEKFSYGKVDEKDRIGVATGMAYTEFGGDLLSIEALKFTGTGKLITTGKLGQVMKESVQAAFSYVRSKAKSFGTTQKQFNKYDFHVHVPEGATPKDGPSAGIAICGSLMSVMTGLKIRKDVAMTGEITLTGRVLPIGGLKEKLLAALRGKIKTVVIPEKNKKNIAELPSEIVKKLEIKTAKNMEEVLKVILVDYKKGK